jgi:uncharacterized membrane protein HdeD (DUF308 family)
MLDRPDSAIMADRTKDNVMLGSRAELNERELARVWWLLALLGTLSVAAGVIVLVKPAISLITIAIVTGIFLLVDGIVEVSWSLFDAVENRGLVAVLGAVSAIAGVILIRHPIRSVVAIALLLGLWLIVAGVTRLVRAFGERRREVSSVLLAVLEVIAGIVIVSSPGIGVATLALLIGISLIVRGVGLFAVGWLMHMHGAHGAGKPTPTGATPVPG